MAASHPHRIQRAETLPPIYYMRVAGKGTHLRAATGIRLAVLPCYLFPVFTSAGWQSFSRLAEFPGMQLNVVKTKNEIDQQSWKSLKQRFRPRAWSSWPCLTA